MCTVEAIDEIRLTDGEVGGSLGAFVAEVVASMRGKLSRFEHDGRQVRVIRLGHY